MLKFTIATFYLFSNIMKSLVYLKGKNKKLKRQVKLNKPLQNYPE